MLSPKWPLKSLHVLAGVHIETRFRDALQSWPCEDRHAEAFALWRGVLQDQLQCLEFKSDSRVCREAAACLVCMCSIGRTVSDAFAMCPILS